MVYDAANIEPVKQYNAKTPLQKAIQILKRHRDKMFEELRWAHLSRPKIAENKVENYLNQLCAPFFWAKYTSAGVL